MLNINYFLYGQVKRFDNTSFKGKVLICPGYVDRYTTIDSTCRKIGKWVYYYKNGNIERIENYRRIYDCSINEVPEGIWQYFNKQGLLIKQDEYKNGKLWTSDIAKYYHKNQLAGVIQIRNGKCDTLKYFKPDDSNFIINGDFNLYFGQPDLQVNDGQNEIGKQIPFWFSQDKNTPDYYNPYRRLKIVPDNMAHAMNEDYNYVGIILYHKPTGSYSEYVTGNISPGLDSLKKYCLRMRIRLSQNSGFYIDRLGVCFSNSIPGSDKPAPQLLLGKVLANREQWDTICSLYTATGNEKYITIGRFSNPDWVNISPIVPLNVSEGEYNQSAYYLIDDVELKEDTIHCNCENKNSEYRLSNRINFDLINSMDSLTWDNTFILKNIFFEFDKSELLPESFSELEKLLVFLKANKLSVIISGHTDDIGSYDYNRALSFSRAGSVSEWLINHGIEKNRIQIEGLGSDYPIVDNNTEENRSVNRRVEFKVKR